MGELEFLDGAIANGEKPLAAIVGGSKVSSKITVLEALIEKCDKVIIGGGMVFTFLAARGFSVGSSLVEEDFIETAKAAEKLAETKNCKIILPKLSSLLISLLQMPTHRLSPLMQFQMDGWVLTTVLKQPKKFKKSSSRVKRWSGTGQWVFSSSMPSQRVLST